MQRIRELIRRIQSSHPSDAFLGDAMYAVKTSRSARRNYEAYERALAVMDLTSLETLYGKAISHFFDHRLGQLKQGFFNQLNDCFAYRYLLSRGCGRIQIVSESTTPQPDLSYEQGGKQHFCEVKTIGISDEEIGRRGTGQAFSANYHQLSTGFFRKLSHDIDQANRQIQARGTDGIVFVVTTLDDFSLTYYCDCRAQLRDFLKQHHSKNVHIKVGIVGSRRIQNFPVVRV